LGSEAKDCPVRFQASDTLALRGLEELFLQLCCCVSFLFWQEIGFGFTYSTTYVLRVPYSCGVVLVYWFWWETVFGVRYVSVFFGLGVTNEAAKPDCILPTGDDGSMNEDRLSGKLIVMIINET
jgi:hypothetical protein